MTTRNAGFLQGFRDAAIRLVENPDEVDQDEFRAYATPEIVVELIDRAIGAEREVRASKAYAMLAEVFGDKVYSEIVRTYREQTKEIDWLRVVLAAEKLANEVLRPALRAVKADRDKLQRLFDEAGPEHNLVALLDSYHERILALRDERDARAPITVEMAARAVRGSEEALEGTGGPVMRVDGWDEIHEALEKHAKKAEATHG